ncbi:DUF11 domain-containing protein [Anaeromicropila herbilytica]|uniref:DUF11 domain-containing protein n=1 Tax=Anaeromicropila herbilytica TaxID=2785025 RepID=A0A7R7ENU0_9FIRM|nr:DUF11 domain-containing protein [Anaeromicropila herbilytica]BCN32026.1 hypothetical protein bsdtb5_33210 [Anaeromicropila herbilytica]
MQVVNECRVDYSYRLSMDSYSISKSIISNTVSTQIIMDQLEVHKRVNKDVTFAYDILTYTILIQNNSNVKIKNAYFYDDIPTRLKYIKNSFLVNGNIIECINLNKGIYIGDVYPNQCIDIKFKVLVLPQQQGEIRNTALVKYDYIYHIERKPIAIYKKSNLTTVMYTGEEIQKIAFMDSILLYFMIRFIRDNL